jgi:methylmalonyl-CoA mutase cobalamin-binding subunit
VDIEQVKAMGVDGVFGPGTNTGDIVTFIRERVGPQSHAA